MFLIRYVQGHVHVFNNHGDFLFSADNEQEARKELSEYEEYKA